MRGWGSRPPLDLHMIHIEHSFSLKKKPLVKYLHFKALKFVRTKYADKDTKVHILSRHALTWSVKHKIFWILEFYIKTKYVHIYKKKKKWN